MSKTQPYQGPTPELLQRKFLQYLGLVLIIALFAATALNIVRHFYLSAYFELFFGVSLTVLWVLYVARRIEGTYFAAIAILNFVLIHVLFITTGEKAGAISLAAMFPLLTSYLFSRRAHVVWSLIFGASLAFHAYLAETSLVSSALDVPTTIRVLLVFGIALYITVTTRRLFSSTTDSLGNTIVQQDQHLQEITQLSDALRQKNLQLEQYKIAFESTSDHIVLTDVDGFIVFANNAVTNITGYSTSEILGTKAGKLWGGLMPRNFYEQLWHTIKEEKKPFRGEIHNRRKDGSDYIAWASISPVIDEHGEVRGFVGLERDITREKEIDRAKTEFVGLASHQLRTPLTAINWYSELLLSTDAGVLTAKQKDYVHEIAAGSQRMTALVNALLNVARIEAGTFSVSPERVYLQEIIETVLKENQPRIQAKKLHIVHEVDVAAAVVNVDRQLMYIIVQNLVTNALKYTPDNGTVTVKYGIDHGRPVLTVSDTGLGIPTTQQDKIFTKLFRADNVRDRESEGTGLGLYIVKSILDHTNGTITFSSKENKGSTFVVTLSPDGMQPKAGTKRLNT